MKVRDAIKGYLLDGRISGQSPIHLENKNQRLSRFADFCEKQEASDIESITVNSIRAFVGFLFECKTDDLDARRAKQSKMLSPSTVRAYMQVIRAFLEWCKRESIIARNPVDSVPSVKTPDLIIPAFRTEQVLAMLEGCKVTDHGARN